MTDSELIDGLIDHVGGEELSVDSRGGYRYVVVDDNGNPVTPGELAMRLATKEKTGYVVIEGDVYTKKARVRVVSNPLANGLTEDRFNSEDGNPVITAEVFDSRS